MTTGLIIGIFVFLGCCVLGGVVFYVFAIIRNKVKDISQIAFGTEDIIEGFKNNEATEDNTPKSLSGMDSILIPQIKRDFPDFNVEFVKTRAKEELKKYVGNVSGFLVHNVVFNQYNKHNNTITIIMQAAAEMYDENNKKQQKRYQLNYTYMPTDDIENKLANCPNCGAPAPSTGESVCAYCGSRIFITIKNSWVFTEILEK